MRLKYRVVLAYLNEELRQLRLATNAEREVERFLKVFLPGTPYANRAHAIGGYVRDQYLREFKKDPTIQAKDLDVLVEMQGGAKGITHLINQTVNQWDPKQPISTPRQLGAGYPIWQITFKDDVDYNGQIYKTKGAIIEFADTMKEQFPDPSSRQRKVSPGTLQEDIERRDFTVNMLLKDLTTGEVKDLTGMSKRDIEQGVLRHVNNVMLDTRFREDPLRMLRLIRFQAKYGWDIPRPVLRVVQQNADRIKIISAERIQEELTKVMKLGKLRQAIRLMDITGLLDHVMPEIKALKGVAQPPEHHAEGDVYRHTLKVLENTGPGVEAQLAALLHDVGKPKAQDTLKDKITFYEHHDVGAEIAEGVMRRLKFDNDTIKRVKSIVKNHMRPMRMGPDPTIKTLRKFVRVVGDEMVDAVLNMAHADSLGRIPSESQIPELRKKIEEARKIPVKKEPVLTGNEIMDILELKSGPEVGTVKDYLKDLEDQYVEEGKELTKEDARAKIIERFSR